MFLAVDLGASENRWETRMRKIRYMVATSLDGYIAGPNGEADWIITDPEVDFGAIFAAFDTLLIGRKTFETMVRAGRAAVPGMKLIVFSRTLRQRDYPDVTIVAEKQKEALVSVRAESGKDIWLFGGSSLFRSILEMGSVDTVEVSVVPILLGAGIPLLPSPAKQTPLKLEGQRVYKTGVVSLTYALK